MAIQQDQDFLAAALRGYEQQHSELVQKIAHIQKQLGGRATAHGVKPARRRRRMSASARKRIAAAQKARWAAYRKKQAK